MNTQSLFVLLRLAYRNVRRHLRRSALTVLVVTVGVGSSIVLASLARGVAKQMAADAIHGLTGHVQIHAPGYLDDPVIERSLPRVPEAALPVLESERVSKWAARIRVPAVVMSERQSLPITLVGIDPEQERNLSIAGDPVAEGRSLEGLEDTGLVLGKKVLETLETGLGKRVVIMTRDAEGQIADRGFRVVGVFDAELESTETSFAFASRSTVANFLSADVVSELALVAVEREDAGALKEQLQQRLPQLDIATWLELEPLIAAMGSIQDGFLLLWFIVVVLCVGFGLVNTIFTSVYERTRELAVMQALGMRPLLIVEQICLESLLLVVIGIVAGIAAGLWGIALLADGIDISRFARGAGYAGIGSVVYPNLLLRDLLLIVGLLLVVSIVGTFYPAWTASRQPPTRAMA